MTPRQTPRTRFAVVRDDGPNAAALRGAVVAMGNFDGVHRGHRAVIAAALARARAIGRPAAALTLEPHPLRFFRPDIPLFRLTDEATKLRLLAACGLDGAIVLTFDAALANLTAEEFVAKILVGRYAISGAVIGFNFHFGKARGGSPDVLAREGARCGFSVDIVPPLANGGRPVSSGVIRDALAAGRVEAANALLGYPWFVAGEVRHGEKRGRDLGFPTANLRLDPHCALRHGIYAVRVRAAGRVHDGVASFGRRPTFDNGAPLLEAFLFDYAGDLYGRRIEVAFFGWVRGEEKFSSADALVARMKEDAARAREILANCPDAFPEAGEI